MTGENIHAALAQIAEDFDQFVRGLAQGDLTPDLVTMPEKKLLVAFDNRSRVRW